MKIPIWGKYSLAGAAMIAPILVGQGGLSNAVVSSSAYASSYLVAPEPRQPVAYSSAGYVVNSSEATFAGGANYYTASTFTTFLENATGRAAVTRLASQPGSAASGAVIAGGIDPAGNCLPAVSVFDEEKDQWIAIPQMPEARAHAGVIEGSDGNLYVIGGDDCHGTVYNTVERYDGIQWSILGSGLNTARTGLAVVQGNDGNLYAIGGADSAGNSLKSVEVSKLTTTSNQTWQPAVASLQTARAYLGAVVAFDNTIYAVGGKGESGSAVASIEKLPSSRAQWQVIGSLKEARSHAGVVLDEGDRITAVGGQSGTKFLTSVEIFDPATNQSSDTPGALSQGLADPSVAVGEDGNILVSGGRNGGGAVENAEELDLGSRASHALTLYLHSNSEPAIDGSFNMDRRVPTSNASGSPLSLGQLTSWVSDPAFTGSFTSGATAIVTQACSVGVSVAPTYTLSAVTEDDDSESVLGTATPLLGLCLGTSTVSIPLPAVTLQNRALKLSISNGVGLNLGTGNSTLALNNFTGEP